MLKVLVAYDKSTFQRDMDDRSIDKFSEDLSAYDPDCHVFQSECRRVPDGGSHRGPVVKAIDDWRELGEKGKRENGMGIGFAVCSTELQ